jgi:hypothetical protein
LLWFLQRQRIPTPLILSNSNPTQDLAASFQAGSLADPAAVPIYGGGRTGPTTYSGFRAMVGLDLTDNGNWGVEVGGFWLPRQVSKFTVTSATSPVIVLPYTNINPNPATGPLGESGGVFSGNFGGVQLKGFAQAITATQLWGSDANLTSVCLERGTCRVEGLVGFRYAGLNDLFQLNAAVTQNGNGSIFDRFSTTNNFYGPQVGIRAEWNPGRCTLALTNKTAMGVTDSVLDITGNAILPSTSAGLGPQLPGGFYTSAANIGRTETTQFSVINETNLTLRVAISSRVSLTAGYSLFYWSDVQRAGENVSRDFNPSFNPAFAPVLGIPLLSGPPAPLRLNNVSNNFWAHGVNLGLQIEF